MKQSLICERNKFQLPFPTSNFQQLYYIPTTREKLPFPRGYGKYMGNDFDIWLLITSQFFTELLSNESSKYLR